MILLRFLAVFLGGCLVAFDVDVGVWFVCCTGFLFML